MSNWVRIKRAVVDTDAYVLFALREGVEEKKNLFFICGERVNGESLSGISPAYNLQTAKKQLKKIMKALA